MALIEKYSKKPRFRNFSFLRTAFLFRGCFSSVSFLTLSFCLRDSASLHCTFGTLFKSFSRDHSVFSPRRLPSVLVLRREPAPESFTSSVVHLSKIKFPKALRTFSKNFYVFFYFCKTIAPVIGFVNTPCRIFFRILQKHIKISRSARARLKIACAAQICCSLFQISFMTPGTGCCTDCSRSLSSQEAPHGVPAR